MTKRKRRKIRKAEPNMGLQGAKTKGDKLVSSLFRFRWPKELIGR